MANSEILLYQTEDGQTKINVRLEDETVWLSQVQMAELFQTTKQNISLHIKNVFDEGELQEISTVKDYLTVQTEALTTPKLAQYNIAVKLKITNTKNDKTGHIKRAKFNFRFRCRQQST